MGEFQYLTINGITYTVADPDAAVIRDDTVGAGAWSGKNIADRLCPLFSESGSIVSCQPLEGYPLTVVSQIQGQQAGSGSPAPENIRPLTGWDKATLTQENGQTKREFSVRLGQTVWSGSLDWNTGILTVDKILAVFDGTENWGLFGGFYMIGGLPGAGAQASLASTAGCCSHYRYTYGTAEGVPGWSPDASNSVATPRFVNTGFATVEQWKAYVAAQYAGGTPVTFGYPLKTPVTAALTPYEIPALAGVNTLRCTTGETAVSGRADPTVLFEKLLAAANG